MRRAPLRLAHQPLALAALLALGSLPSDPALGANCTWNPATGNWSTPANWSCGIVPGAADSATIAVAKTVTVDSVQSILNLSNAGSINLDAFLLTLAGGGGTTNTGTINVGAGPNPNNAALQVSSGHSITNTGGTINVSADSVINQFGSSITGGTINTSGSGRLVAFNSSANFLSGVTLGGRLDMAGGTGIERITGGLVMNNATIDIGANSILAPQGDQSFSGAGTIVFANDGSGSNRLNLEAGHLTLESGITVRGGNGVIGNQSFVGGGATLTNNGTIAADVAGTSISLVVNGTVNNNGTLKAENGGTLNINTNVVGGGGSQIVAGAGSVVNQNSVTLSGAMNIIGTGSFRANNNGTNMLAGVALSGTLDLATATGIERVSGGLTFVNNATINIGSNSILAPQGDQTFSGSGQIVFTDASGSNRFNLEAGTLTLASGITVRGGNGDIGNQNFVGGGAALINHGTIQADVAGRTINLGVNGLTTNHGTLAALNGGTLNLNSAVDGVAGSQIIAGAGSVVNQNSVTLSGNMTLSGAGSFRPNNNGNNFLSGVTFAGTLDLASATGIERVAGGLTMVNNAVVNIGKNSIFAPQGNQTIAGSGSFVFADDGSASNRFNVEAGTTTLASGITIRGGDGTIGQQSFVGGAAALINQGVVAADVAGGTIVLTVNGLTTNQNLMKASNGGTLRLDRAVDNSAGTLLAEAGSVVFINSVEVSGGLLSSSGSGVFRTSNNSNNFINGVTLGGVLDLASATSIARVSSGGMVLNGRIDIGANSTFAPQGNQTLSGTGSIVFADASGSNRFNVEAGTTTIGSGVTVRGGNGVIGEQSFLGGAAALINQGVVAADVAGRTIRLTVNGLTTNQNLMKAANGGTLRFDSSVDNSAGTLLAEAGSVVFFNGMSVTGGLLTSGGSGVFRTSNSSNNFINGVTLGGVLDMASGTGHARISSGGMVLDGRIDIGANSTLAPQGVQTISGSGVINFADAGGSNRLNVEAGTLTLGSGITVHGINGVIGQQAHLGGAATLINEGTINSDGGGTISINVNGSTVNNGTMRAQSGTLTIQDNLSGTGTLQADAAGVINLANGGNTQGRLIMGAAGSAIAIGNGNLVINTDYTNAGAGSGNSFNRRAGVAGAGLIVAGGDVAQVITGAGVSNGSTTNATLTIGNLRVGDNTFNIQIGNAGTTGPTLRGAIQTTVNGGNITDARLSGSGVTPANYNAGGPGGNSGDLSVIFSAASAGALSPLTGQVVNLRSNFENIANQKLNIELGSGAAAYNAAVGAATPSPVVVANQRVGGSNNTALSVTNTAPGGAFSEDLRATFGANTGMAMNNGGIVSALIAQGVDASSMRVSVDTASAGAKAGTVTLNYQTTGTVNGVSNGLPLAGANAPQVIDVSGNVYLAAQPSPGSLPGVVNLGNFRAGAGAQNAPAISITNTNLAPAGFQEGLTASIVSTSGSATGSGFTNAAAGSSGNLTVGLSGIAAGNNTGTVGVQLRSSGLTTGGDTGLGVLNLGGVQNITVNGTGWRLAQPNAIGPIDFGNVLANTVQTRTVSISNLAATDGFSEALNAAFGTIGGANPLRFSTSGAIAGLLAGLTDNATMQVTLDTSSTGAVSANVQILLTSNGTAVGNGLGLTALPTQTINLDGLITANVGNLAVASLAPTNVNFGKFREGAANQTQQLTIANIASGPAEGLNASFGSASGGASHNGASIVGLAPGASDATSMSVALGGLATAGAKAGSVTVDFASDGSFNNGTPTSLPSQTVNLAAEVYRLALASVTPTLALAARRVGEVGSSAVLTVANTAAADGFSEGLQGTLGAAPAGFTVSGPAATGLIAAGSNAMRTVTLETGTAGVFGGNISVALASDGAGTSGFGQLALVGQSTAVSGKVYAPAVGQLATPVIDFGVVRVGDAVAERLLSVNNIAPGSALDDTLRANLSGIGGPFTTGGTVGGIAAGGSGTIGIGLSTASAGVHTQNGTLAFLSQNPDMSDASAGDNAALTVMAQINNLANADFDKLAGLGLLTQNGSEYVLDLGTLLVGQNVASFLQLDNDVAGPADDLSGSFDLGAADDFLLTGWNPFANLAASGAVGGLDISFVAAATGLFEDRIAFNGIGTNASDPQGLAQTRQLLIRARVIDGGGNVPEPGSLMLLLAAAAGAMVARRRRASRRP